MTTESKTPANPETTAAQVSAKAPAKAVAKAAPKAITKPETKAAVVPKPVAKPKVAAKPKAIVKPKTQTTAKPAAKPVAAKPVAAKAIVKEVKARKPKMVRDSFTFPKDEYSVLDALKLRGAKLGSPVKKTELLRAGVKAIAAMTDAALLAALKAVPSLKTGRPAKS
jgi:hypothetical protein